MPTVRKSYRTVILEEQGINKYDINIPLLKFLEEYHSIMQTLDCYRNI